MTYDTQIERLRRYEALLGEAMMARAIADKLQPKTFTPAHRSEISAITLQVLRVLDEHDKPVTASIVGQAIGYNTVMASHRISSCVARGFARRVNRKRGACTYEITEEGRECLATN